MNKAQSPRTQVEKFVGVRAKIHKNGEHRKGDQSQQNLKIQDQDISVKSAQPNLELYGTSDGSGFILIYEFRETHT